MAWRRHRGLTQAGLAELASLSRPHLSKLEKGKADPALSCLRRLALALDIRVGQLVEDFPEQAALTREQLDRLARGALRPGTRDAHTHKGTRVLALLNRERRKALGLYVPKKEASSKSTPHASAVNSARWLRASLGEKQWKAILQRIEKLAASSRTS